MEKSKHCSHCRIRNCHCTDGHLNWSRSLFHCLIDTYSFIGLVVDVVPFVGIGCAHHISIHTQEQERTAADLFVVDHHKDLICIRVWDPLSHWRNRVHVVTLFNVEESTLLVLGQVRGNHGQTQPHDHWAASSVTEVNSDSWQFDKVSVVDNGLTEVSIQLVSWHAWRAHADTRACVARRLTGLTVIVGVFVVPVRAACWHTLTAAQWKSRGACQTDCVAGACRTWRLALVTKILDCIEIVTGVTVLLKVARRTGARSQDKGWCTRCTYGCTWTLVAVLGALFAFLGWLVGPVTWRTHTETVPIQLVNSNCTCRCWLDCTCSITAQNIGWRTWGAYIWTWTSVAVWRTAFTFSAWIVGKVCDRTFTKTVSVQLISTWGTQIGW